MSYSVIVYSMADGSEVPDTFEVVLPDGIEESDIDTYIEANYPEVGEYQIEPG
jgi:hypothetical protein